MDSINTSDIDNYETEIKPAFKQIYTGIYHSEQTKNIQGENEEDFFNEVNRDYFFELYFLYSNNLIEYDLIEYKEAKKEIFNYLKMIKNIKKEKKEKVKDIIKEKKVIIYHLLKNWMIL